MIEVFKYTERVVNMVRPRKLLFMAIGELRKFVKVYSIVMFSYRRSCSEGEDEPTTVPTIPLCTGGT